MAALLLVLSPIALKVGSGRMANRRHFICRCASSDVDARRYCFFCRLVALRLVTATIASSALSKVYWHLFTQPNSSPNALSSIECSPFQRGPSTGYDALQPRGNAMKRRSRAGGKPAEPRPVKTVTLKRRSASPARRYSTPDRDHCLDGLSMPLLGIDRRIEVRAHAHGIGP